jgi:hypothetical protein
MGLLPALVKKKPPQPSGDLASAQLLAIRRNRPRRSDSASVTSGLPPKADNLRASRHFAFVPIGDLALMIEIGIGGDLLGRSPATPPGVRVRTGRFEKLRS